MPTTVSTIHNGKICTQWINSLDPEILADLTEETLALDSDVNSVEPPDLIVSLYGRPNRANTEILIS